VFEGSYALYGAQPVEVFKEALEAARDVGRVGHLREDV
jgi:predicted DsbA family dithiol-disulfide isomerase